MKHRTLLGWISALIQLLARPPGPWNTGSRSPISTTSQQAWTTFVWDGNPGDTVAFMVKSEMAAWQEVWAVAANPGGTLRRLSIGGPTIFGHPWQEVPEVSQAFLANAVDRGTFPQWVARHAKASDGLSVVVGRRLNTVYDPDRVYLLITLPPEPYTFKLIVGWRDHDDRGNG